MASSNLAQYLRESSNPFLGIFLLFRMPMKAEKLVEVVKTALSISTPISARQ